MSGHREKREQSSSSGATFWYPRPPITTASDRAHKTESVPDTNTAYSTYPRQRVCLFGMSSGVGELDMGHWIAAVGISEGTPAEAP